MTSTASRRPGLVVALAFSAGLFVLGAVQGQAPFNVPKVWKCSRCGAVLGQGEAMPQLASCPLCGMHFADGAGLQKLELAAKAPALPFNNNPLLNQQPNKPTSSNPMSSLTLMTGLVFFGVVLIVAGTILIGVALSAPAREEMESRE